MLQQIAAAGSSGVSLQHLYTAEGAEEKAERDAIKQLVTRLRNEDHLVERVGRGVYRATPAAEKVVRELAPDERPPGGDGARVLPEFNLTANAGPVDGAVLPDGPLRVIDLTEDSDTVTGRYFIDPREIEGIPEGEGFVVPVYGRSMVPDFQPGDRVVCRRYKGGWDGLVDGHYLIRIGGVGYIKALSRRPRRKVGVVSTNQAEFPPYELDLNAPEDADDVEVLAVVYGHFKRYWE